MSLPSSRPHGSHDRHSLRTRSIDLTASIRTDPEILNHEDHGGRKDEDADRALMSVFPNHRRRFPRALRGPAPNQFFTSHTSRNGIVKDCWERAKPPTLRLRRFSDFRAPRENSQSPVIVTTGPDATHPGPAPRWADGVQPVSAPVNDLMPITPGARAPAVELSGSRFANPDRSDQLAFHVLYSPPRAGGQRSIAKGGKWSPRNHPERR